MGSLVEKAKEMAASKALNYLYDAEIIGVGTGSTIKKLIAKIGLERDVFSAKIFVPSSYDTLIKLQSLGLKVVSTEFLIKKPDVYVDGADEVTRNLVLIKGRGGALLREKILAYFSKKRIYIVDYTKLVSVLGEKKPLPVEVVPYALGWVLSELRKKKLNPRIRMCRNGKDGPVITDSGNTIIDLYVKIQDPESLERELKGIPGIVETGLFINLADMVIVGYPNKVDVITP